MEKQHSPSGYVIVRSDDMFVAKPGREQSYTRDIRQIWVFATVEEAEKNACKDNELVIALADVMGGSDRL